MGRLSGRRAWRRTLASACAVGLVVAVGTAAAPGAVAAVPQVIRATEPGPYSPPAGPTGEPEPTSPPPTVEPPVGTSAPASPSAPTPGATTGGPTPSSGPPTATGSPPRPTYSPPSRPPVPTLAPPVSLFPPGPPAPGITLSAGEVSFDAEGVSDGLLVRLRNTGRVDAAGRVDVLLPSGVTVPALPPGCAAVAATRTRCDLGSVRAGRTGELRLPVTATPQAQRAAPLSGAVIGRLDPRHGAARRTQLSFRITAASPEVPAVVPPPAPVTPPSLDPAWAAPDDGAGLASGQHAATVITVWVLLALLVLGLATAWLRRRGTSATARSAEVAGGARRTGTDDPAGTAPKPDTGIWFRARRPARSHDGPGWDTR